MSEGTLPISEYSSNRATRPTTDFVPLSGVTGLETRRSGHGTGSTTRTDAAPFERDQPKRLVRAALTQGQPVAPELLKSAEETLRSLDGADDVEVQLLLTSLVGIVSDMWESAADASDTHQQVLASVENAVRVAAARGRQLHIDESLAIGGAIHFLKERRLVRANAESVRSDFVQAGFPPLALLD